MFHYVSGAVECPTCRTQHDLPPKGVEGFTTNFTAATLVNLHSTIDTSPGTTAPVTAVLKCEDGIDDPGATKCLIRFQRNCFKPFPMATLSNTLTCSECKKLLTSPKLLPCLHTFCKECLEERSHGLQKGGCGLQLALL